MTIAVSRSQLVIFNVRIIKKSSGNTKDRLKILRGRVEEGKKHKNQRSVALFLYHYG